MMFHRTKNHAPEPGLGGAEYEVSIMVGTVKSTWNRTNGVHWLAYRNDGAVVMSGKTPRPFESRQQAAQYLVNELTG